ncbi:MAG: nicotinate phosphoribosyltransferase [Sulfurimonas sp.]|nr:MAG: nicotinate phosphoribosyltransferase [Sulfurimonas sp.]
MKYYSYENFKDDTKKLNEKVKEFKPQTIIAIARGGLTLSHVMAEGLDIRDVQSIRTELYDNVIKRDELSIFGECKLSKVTRVLVVDDISDSGETLKLVMNDLIKKNTGIEFKSATLFYKATSIYEPDFWINEATEWIEFFWEKDFK